MRCRIEASGFGRHAVKGAWHQKDRCAGKKLPPRNLTRRTG
jgi:hypothetical protein